MYPHRLRRPGCGLSEPRRCARLSRQRGERFHRGGPRDSSVAVLERLVSGVSWVGRSFPLYCDDAGQALLWDCERDEVELIFRDTDFVAYSSTTPTSTADFCQRLERSREAGYSLVDGESQPGVYAIAAPVRDFTGTVRCALHIQGPTHTLAPRARELGPTIRSWPASFRAIGLAARSNAVTPCAASATEVAMAVVRPEIRCLGTATLTATVISS